MKSFIASLFLSPIVQGVTASATGIASCRTQFSNAITSKEIPLNIMNKLTPCLPYLNKPLFDYKMTPLHLAAQKGNGEAIDLFVQMGANLDLQDANKLTPLLHAAVHGHALAAGQLLNKGADSTLLSKYGGNYADYLRMNAPFRPTNTPIDATLAENRPYSTHLKRNLEIESRCLKKGVVVADENVVKPKMLAKLLQEKSDEHHLMTMAMTDSIQKTVQADVLKSYEHYKNNPPPLAIRRVTHSDAGHPIKTTMCGVFAKMPISKGTVIDEYTGEIKPKSPFEDETYRVEDYPVTDSIKYRSAASMANHGFPNSYILHLAKGNFDTGLDGLPFRKLLVAINDIAEGEEIVWHYGGDYQIPSKVELKPQALHDFLKTISWDDIIEVMTMYGKTSSPEKQGFKYWELVPKFYYFTETPAAIAFAIKNKYFTQKDLKRFKSELAKDFCGHGCKLMFKKLIDTAIPLLRKREEL